jgi:multisubunit Na+/H+ antiporter MnhC subunit
MDLTYAERGSGSQEANKVDEPKIADELRQMEGEPLLPVEKKLIVWSIVVGVALCWLLVWVAHRFFSK